MFPLAFFSDCLCMCVILGRVRVRKNHGFQGESQTRVPSLNVIDLWAFESRTQDFWWESFVIWNDRLFSSITKCPRLSSLVVFILVVRSICSGNTVHQNNLVLH